MLDQLVKVLKSEKKYSSVMKHAVQKASKAANEFASKHPVYTSVILTVVAVGVLVLLMPWAVEALGFGELGPLEGKRGGLASGL